MVILGLGDIRMCTVCINVYAGLEWTVRKFRDLPWWKTELMFKKQDVDVHITQNTKLLA